MYFPRSSSANAPTYITSVESVQPVSVRHSRTVPSQCTDVCNFFSVGLTSVQNFLCLDFFDLDFFTVSSILVPWTEEVSGRCPETREGRLPLDPRPRGGGPSGLATPIFSLSSLEPKSLIMVILTIILVQVLCCLYQSPKHYIEIWHERPFSLQPPMACLR